MLFPLLAGHWDACHFWCQWTALDGATYLFEWRWRNRTSDAECVMRDSELTNHASRITNPSAWSAWQPVSRDGGLQRPWLAVPTWRAGAEIQARVAVASSSPEWELAQEVTFLKSRVRFRGRSEREAFAVPAGTELACIVDGAACVYRLIQDLVIPALGAAEADAESLGASGYMQLDHPGHFAIRPALGVTIENIAPSENDVQPTGRASTILSAAPACPPRIAFRRANVR